MHLFGVAAFGRGVLNRDAWCAAFSLSWVISGEYRQF